MDLLVLGGGGFLGHHVVAAAVAAGHRVTVFSRSGASEFDAVEVLRGDRTGDLSPLRGRRWDGVVDTFTDAAPGAPAIRASASQLSGAVGAYAYTSGMSVYAPSGPRVPDESAPVRRAGVEPDDDPLQARSIAKLAGEAAVREAFDGPALFPRVGIMVGPRDPTSRFTHWPVRFAAALAGRLSRRVPVPGDLDRPVQYSDARDIAAWIVDSVAARRDGVFNTVGPGRTDTLRQVLDACLAAAGGSLGDLELVPVGEDRSRPALEGVEEEERPLWWPEDQIPQSAIDASAALAAGLRFRSAADTAADALADAERTGNAALTDGAYAAREDRLLGTSGPGRQ